MGLQCQLDNTVMRMFNRYSGNGTLLSESANGQYDPTTSEYTSIDCEYPIRVMLFDFLTKKDGDTTIKNTLIEEGDKQCYIQPTEKLAGGIPLPRIQPNKDRIQIGDRIYRVITYKEINPSSVNCTLIEVYLRG